MESDGSSIGMLLAALVLTVALASFFLTAVFALTKSRLSRVNEFKEDQFFGSSIAVELLENREHYLLAAQLGVTVSAALLGFAAHELTSAPAVAQLAAQYLPGWPAVPLLFALMLVLAAGATISLAQVIKGIFRHDGDIALCYLAPVFRRAALLGSPLISICRAIAGRLLARLGFAHNREQEAAISAEELSEIIELGTESGAIEEDEREMIESVFTFSDTVAREIMTPRKEVVAVSELASLDEVTSVFRQHGVSRLLVIGEHLDDVKGVVIAKDLLPYVGRTAATFSLQQIMRDAYFVGGDKKTDDLFQELRRQAIHLAVVLDEHGGVDGVVTMEDLVEEIVGEIRDEYDRPEDEFGVVKTKAGDLIVDGGVLVHDLNERYDCSFPNGEYDTVAGFVIHKLGRMPEIGDSVTWDGYLVKVEKMGHNRVTKVRLSRTGAVKTS